MNFEIAAKEVGTIHIGFECTFVIEDAINFKEYVLPHCHIFDGLKNTITIINNNNRCIFEISGGMKFAFPANLGPIMLEFTIEPSIGVTLHLVSAYIPLPSPLLFPSITSDV